VLTVGPSACTACPLGLVTKTVKAGDNSGYEPNSDVELEFKLWAVVRYDFFAAPPPPDQWKSQLDFEVDVEARGLHVASAWNPDKSGTDQVRRMISVASIDSSSAYGSKLAQARFTIRSPAKRNRPTSPLLRGRQNPCRHVLTPSRRVVYFRSLRLFQSYCLLRGGLGHIDCLNPGIDHTLH